MGNELAQENGKLLARPKPEPGPGITATLFASFMGPPPIMRPTIRRQMAKPKVLMMDEPSMGLAPKLVTLVFDLIRQLRDHGITILLVEQNARKTLKAANYAYVLELGRVVLEGPSSDLSINGKLKDAYLGI